MYSLQSQFRIVGPIFVALLTTLAAEKIGWSGDCQSTEADIPVRIQADAVDLDRYGPSADDLFTADWAMPKPGDSVKCLRIKSEIRQRGFLPEQEQAEQHRLKKEFSVFDKDFDKNVQVFGCKYIVKYFRFMKLGPERQTN